MVKRIPKQVEIERIVRMPDSYKSDRAHANYREYEIALHKKQQAYNNLVRDAYMSAKLNEWEGKFVRGMKEAMESGHVTTMEECSEKQQKVWKEIEEKIYAVG